MDNDKEVRIDVKNKKIFYGDEEIPERVASDICSSFEIVCTAHYIYEEFDVEDVNHAIDLAEYARKRMNDCGLSEDEAIREAINELGLGSENYDEECEEESDNLYNNERDCMRISLYNIKGTVVITDPCYVVRKDEAGTNWGKCDYGSNMGTLGFKHSLVSTTLYGDGGGEITLSSSKITNNTEFGVDSGQIGVFLLEEILEHNPDFKKDYIENRPWCAAVIPNFEGEVYIEIDYAPADKYNLSDDDDEKEDYNEDELMLSIVGFGKDYNFKYSGNI